MSRADHQRGRTDHQQRVAAVSDQAAAAGLVPDRGLTTAEVARRYRVSATKVRAWIASGKLRAVNTADVTCSKPRYVVTVEALAEFERSRSTAPTPKAPRRRRTSGQVDFFPD